MDFSTIPLPPLSFFLGILYLINAYTSDGQCKEPQQQQCWGQQWGNNHNVNLPPPPPPTLKKVLAMQA
jgi:hypothetical protein